MTKQQENRAFVKMLKEFPKEFGRVSFRERLMLRTAFDYINEEVIADIKANCDLAIEGRDIKIKELETENAELKEKIEVLECDNYNANCNLNLITDHLTKARGLLAKWVELYNPKLEGYPITPIQEQTEQFLKEIEE